MIERTPEQKAASVAKSIETRRVNREIRKAEEENAKFYACSLNREIKALEEKLSKLKIIDDMSTSLSRLTGKVLLREEEIVNSALMWDRLCGVYFLIHGGAVVYVGQSTNIFSRIQQHKQDNKKFTHFAYVLCDKNSLDILESIYIHCIRPPHNGKYGDAMAAPLSLEKVVASFNSFEKTQPSRR